MAARNTGLRLGVLRRIGIVPVAVAALDLPVLAVLHDFHLVAAAHVAGLVHRLFLGRVDQPILRATDRAEINAMAQELRRNPGKALAGRHA